MYFFGGLLRCFSEYCAKNIAEKRYKLKSLSLHLELCKPDVFLYLREVVDHRSTVFIDLPRYYANHHGDLMIFTEKILSKFQLLLENLPHIDILHVTMSRCYENVAETLISFQKAKNKQIKLLTFAFDDALPFFHHTALFPFIHEIHIIEHKFNTDPESFTQLDAPSPFINQQEAESVFPQVANFVWTVHNYQPPSWLLEVIQRCPNSSHLVVNGEAVPLISQVAKFLKPQELSLSATDTAEDPLVINFQSLLLPNSYCTIRDSLQELRLEYIHSEDDSFRAIAEFRNLHTLVITNCVIPNEDLTFVFRRCPILASLKLSDMRSLNKTLLNVVCGAMQIDNLEVVDCDIKSSVLSHLEVAFPVQFKFPGGYSVQTRYRQQSVSLDLLSGTKKDPQGLLVSAVVEMLASPPLYRHVKKLSLCLPFLRSMHLYAIQSGCPLLRELDLNCITDDDDEIWKNFTLFPQGWQHLRTIDLSATQVSLPFVRAVASCSKVLEEYVCAP